MKIGITRFPGTNCDYDIWTFVKELGHQPQWLWHQDHFDPKEVEAVIIPGGFSYGDYLRSGALAARSPVMTSVRDFAGTGRPVLGICNGFQILCEAHLLPGALLRNESLKFQDEWAELEVENPNSFFGKNLKKREKLSLPIAHGDGRFYAAEGELRELEDRGQVWLRYKTNVNGSLHQIAGVMNQMKNVSGLMPHPERALWDWAGGLDGRSFL
jgi:phosphoribosylformylglycinamidine synthase I